MTTSETESLKEKLLLKSLSLSEPLRDFPFEDQIQVDFKMKIRHDLQIIKEEVEDKQLERRQWNWWYEEKEPTGRP